MVFGNYQYIHLQGKTDVPENLQNQLDLKGKREIRICSANRRWQPQLIWKHNRSEAMGVSNDLAMITTCFNK